MAENELTVIRADGATRTLRSADLGGSVHAQVALVAEATLVPVSPAGGAVRYTVDSDPPVAIDTPTATARYARVRVFETTSPTTPNKRMYYREDGVNPNANGSDAQGFLLHGDTLLVRLADLTQFRMIADNTDNGIFQVYVEFLNVAAS